MSAALVLPAEPVALAELEPLKISGSHTEREERAQRLANLFIGEMVPLLVQVRQDFFDKEPNETICGVKTFTEYCTGVLRYSESHVRRLIKGQNPASPKHDGSAHRKPKAEPPEPPAPGDDGPTASLRAWFAEQYKAFKLSPSLTPETYDLRVFKRPLPPEVEAVSQGTTTWEFVGLTATAVKDIGRLLRAQ